MQRTALSPIHLTLALALAGCNPVILDPFLVTGSSGGETATTSTTSTSGSSDAPFTTGAETTGTTSTSTGSSDTGVASFTTQADTSGGQSETGMDPSGGNFIVPPEDPGCDPWAQDCPVGHKCAAEGPPPLDHGSVACTPIVPDPDQAGEPCQVLVQGELGPDTCDAGLFCWDVDPNSGLGTCVELCQGSPDNPVCDPGAQCLSLPLPLCLATCDPLLQDCPANLACINSGLENEFICAPLADPPFEQALEPCHLLNICDAGLACINVQGAAECDPQEVGCCSPYCEVGGPDICPGAGQACLPWYEPGQAPPGLEHVGVCHLPL